MENVFVNRDGMEIPKELRYYNECIHKASFCLPEFLRKKLMGIKG